MQFKDFELKPEILAGIKDAGWTDCTEVQEQTFQATLNLKDVVAQSQTGTGKTAAFLISLFQLMDIQAKQKALILVPTRELAVQIEKEAKLIGKYLEWNIGSIFGGIGYNEQEHLINNSPHMIIATPGRLLDFVSSKKINLKEFTHLVIDEADRCLDMGFLPELKKILRQLPSFDKRHTMLFSATMTYTVDTFIWEYVNEPVNIRIDAEKMTVDEISQELYHVSRADKMSLLLGVLKKESPQTSIIFTNTKTQAVTISKRLNHNGLKAQYIMGDLPQRKRLKVIDRMKKGEIQYLVATDVAARGLHIDDLDLVLNFDLPEDYENYVHRIGRTARAGKTGKAVSFACESYVYHLEAIEKFTQQKIPVVWAEEALFIRDESHGLHFSESRKRVSRPDTRQKRDRIHSPHRPKPVLKKKTGIKPVEKTETAQKPVLKKKTGIKPVEKIETAQKPVASLKPKAKAKARPHKELPKHGKNRQKTTSHTNVKRPKSGDIHERIQYYKAKYGEDFKVDEKVLKELDHQKKEDKGVLQKVFRFFKK